MWRVVLCSTVSASWACRSTQICVSGGTPAPLAPSQRCPLGVRKEVRGQLHACMHVCTYARACVVCVHVYVCVCCVNVSLCMCVNCVCVYRNV